MPETPEQNFYTSLAASLHKAADQIASLAGGDLPRTNTVHLFLSVSSDESAADRSKPVVDAFARVFGSATQTEVSKYSAHYKTDTKIGDLRVRAYTEVPRPAPKKSTAAQLRAENERLRAELEKALAAGTPMRDSAIVKDGVQ
jgi:hypothetical protein